MRFHWAAFIHAQDGILKTKTSSRLLLNHIYWKQEKTEAVEVKFLPVPASLFSPVSLISLILSVQGQVSMSTTQDAATDNNASATAVVTTMTTMSNAPVESTIIPGDTTGTTMTTPKSTPTTPMDVATTTTVATTTVATATTAPQPIMTTTATIINPTSTTTTKATTAQMTTPKQTTTSRATTATQSTTTHSGGSEVKASLLFSLVPLWLHTLCRWAAEANLAYRTETFLSPLLRYEGWAELNAWGLRGRTEEFIGIWVRFLSFIRVRYEAWRFLILCLNPKSCVNITEVIAVLYTDFVFV